jgi:hypothetical protein
MSLENVEDVMGGRFRVPWVIQRDYPLDRPPGFQRFGCSIVARGMRPRSPLGS